MSDYPGRWYDGGLGDGLQPGLFQDAHEVLVLTAEELSPTVPPDVERDASLDERFEAFHRANPHVYEELRRLALEMRRRGVRRYGIKGLFEVLRWRYALQTRGDEFKLNNSYTSRYARLLMEREPELRGFFEVRELKSA